MPAFPLVSWSHGWWRTRRAIDERSASRLARCAAARFRGRRRRRERACLLRGERSTRGLPRGRDGWGDRRPRGVGLALAVVLILGAGAFGAMRGRRICFLRRARRQRPRFPRARARLRHRVVTISGQRSSPSPEILARRRHQPENSLLFLDVAQARGAPGGGAPDQTGERAQALPEPSRHRSSSSARLPRCGRRTGQVNIVSADGAVIDRCAISASPACPSSSARAPTNGSTNSPPWWPPLRRTAPEDRAGVLVANRRWNLKMTSGVEVMLPEINPLAAVATLGRAAAPIAHSRSRRAFARSARRRHDLRAALRRGRRRARRGSHPKKAGAA